jgi:large subunit ribosomal protein L29
MKAEKLRDMNPDELRNEETRLVDQIFRLRFQIAASQAENPARVHLLRKDLARVKTILREKAGPASVAVKSTAAAAGAAVADKPATGKAVAGGAAAGGTEAVSAGSAKMKPARSVSKVGRQGAAKSGGTVKAKGAAKAKGAKQERG